MKEIVTDKEDALDFKNDKGIKYVSAFTSETTILKKYICSIRYLFFND